MKKRSLIFFLMLALLSGSVWAQSAYYSYSNITSSYSGSTLWNDGTPANLLDNSLSTKYCPQYRDDTWPTYSRVDFESNDLIIPTGYVIYTGDDTQQYTGRNPKNWTIQAKVNSSDSWTTIHTVTNAGLPTTNKTAVTYSFSNTTAYKYFRFEITAIESGGIGQLQDFHFIATVQGGGDSGDSDCTEIGTSSGNDYKYGPVNDYYNYSYYQIIYPKAEVPTGSITSIGFNYAYTSAMSKKNNVTIYMGTTSSNTLSDWMNVGTMTKVYTGSLNCTQQGWNDFTLTTPYTYSGSQNLVVVIMDQSGQYDGSSFKFYYATSTNNVNKYAYTDTQSNITFPSNDTGTPTVSSSATSGNVTYYPVTRFCTAPNIPTEIYTVADWEAFCSAVNGGHSYSGETVTLMNDITTAVTTMAGTITGETLGNAFKGTFDGQGYTLTLDISGGADEGWYFTAPFRCIDGATIKNLKTTGTVTQTGGKGAAGIVGCSTGTCTITNCVSNVTINSQTDDDGTHGGFISYIKSGTTTFNGCAFTGSITGSSTYQCGGFVGWKAGSANFNNCVFAPTAITFDYTTGNSANFSRNGGNFNNCYYTQTCGTGWTQGKLMHSITGASGITVANDGSVTSYTPETSTIVGYGTGIKFNNILYAGSGDNVSLNLSASTSGIFYADNATITGNNNSYSLAMPNEDVVVRIAPAITITATANPTEGGSVTGGGTFAQGSSCTLTATANPGYGFINWTKNNVEVSTNASYTFTVSENATYVANFEDICGSITNFPWSEDFEGYNAGNFSDPCWVNEHIEGSGTSVFKVYTSTNGTNSTHQLQLPDMSSGTMTKLVLPKMTIPSSGSYAFSIDVYRNTSTSNYGEGIRVFASTNGNIEGATELGFISRSYTTADATHGIPAESASGWYTYKLPIPITGTCYIILRGESKYGSSTYMDNFIVGVPCSISTNVNPTEAGTVTGAGDYLPSTTCTLTATANTGYNFANWTLNSVVVSTDASYTFTVSEDATYVANFEEWGVFVSSTPASTENLTPSTEVVLTASTNVPYLGLDRYVFNTGNDGSMITPQSWTTIVSSGNDDAASNVTGIGFTFTYDNVDYSNFSANSNGRMRLGDTKIATSYSNPFTSSNYTSNTPAIVGVGRDCSTGSAGYVRTGLYGSEGSYVRVIEFKLNTTSSSSGTTYVMFQVQLFQANNEVRIVYSSDYSNAPSDYQIGIGNADHNKFWYVNPSAHSASYSTTYTGTTYSVYPGARRYYSFTPFTPIYNWTCNAGTAGTANDNVYTVTPTENSSYTVSTTINGQTYTETVEVTMQALTKTIAAYSNSQAEKGGYYLIASPLAATIAPTDVDGMITDELGSTATQETSTYDLYSFNQAQELEWQNYRASNFNLVNGTGYLYASKEGTTLTFSGAPYSGTTKTVTLHKTAAATGLEFPDWNLVGNPFAGDAYITKSFYTLENSDTYTLNTAGTAIQRMQGLLVVADEDGETMTFSTADPNSKVAKLNMNVSNERSVVDQAIISFNEGQELPKLQFRNGSTKVYLPKDGKEYAIVSTEAMGTMPVNFKAENDGTYTLSFTAEEVSFAYLHLIDNMTGNDVDLLATPSYSFDARTTDYESRFKLVFATGNNANDDAFAFYSNGSFVINNEGNATLQVIDVNGRILKSESINGCTNVNVKAAAGVYVLRLVNGNDVKVQKVVVR